MSVVTVQVGQCGNQIGTRLYSLIAEDAFTPPVHTASDTPINVAYRQDVLDTYFTEQSNGSPVAKAVLVDMEQKVIKQCKGVALERELWVYPNNNEYVEKRGSANNWALGYHGNGSVASQNVIEICRREVEKCDKFSGFLVLMSLAGGTGSGIGTHLTYSLRDDFPEAIVGNHIVFPHSTGEVIVQNYNAVLTLSHLQCSSDVLIGHQNDNLLAICQKVLGLHDISFKDINRILAHKLASLLQPSSNDSRNVNVLYDLVQNVASHPAYKMVSIKNVPFVKRDCLSYTTYVWHALIKHMRQMLISDAPTDSAVNWEIKLPTPSTTLSTEASSTMHNVVSQTFNKSIQNVLILRGKGLEEVDTECFRTKQLYSACVPSSFQYAEWRQSRCFHDYEKSMTLVSNSQTFVRPLNDCVEKAWTMFQAGAYLDQYARYGVEKDDFINSFGAVEQIIKDYSSL